MVQQGRTTARAARAGGATSTARAIACVRAVGCAVEALERRCLLASIAGTVFYDPNGNGVIDPGDNGLGGMTVFLDQNANGVHDATVSTIASTDVPKAVVTPGIMTSNNAVSGLSGSIIDVNVTLNLSHTWVGDVILTLISPTGTQVLLASQTGGFNNSGDNYTNTTFDDEASQSIESGSPPYTGTFRPLGQLSNFDGSAPNGTWQLRVEDVFFADGGTLHSWSLQISTGERSTTTDGIGQYSFASLGAGTYRVTQIVPAPYVITSPAGAFQNVTVGASDNVTGRNFGNRFPPGEIRGVKWNDANGNGVQDGGEGGLQNVRVYVDYNENGSWDSGSEPSALTAADGTYTITGVLVGTHLVREIVPPGSTQTFPGAFGSGQQEGTLVKVAGAYVMVGPEPYYDGGGAGDASDAGAIGNEPAATEVEASREKTSTSRSPLIRPIWAPGTPQEVVNEFYASKRSGAGEGDFAEFNFADSSRWTRTATNGAGLTQGQATTLTWRVVNDGTPIPGFAGEPANPSNLRAFLNGIYGSEAVWIQLFNQIFARWSELSGITYVMETTDDGSSFSDTDSASTRGVLGVRADIRIGGHLIDGNPPPPNGSILAYNFFPNIGEMVIDTGDSFYSNTSGNSLGLRNVLSHEHGHGIGLGHVMPVNQTKLMEPFVSFAFDGPQFDDILAANRGYGDRLEKSGGNDAPAVATNLGTLTNGTTTVNDVSIDDDSDTDVFRFTVAAGKRATITVAPVGTTYLSGVQNGPAPTSFHAGAQSNLSLQVLASNGSTVLTSMNVHPGNFSEQVKNLPLGAGGQYFVRINGSADAVQMYSLTVTIADALPGTHSVAVGPAQIVNGVNFGNQSSDVTPPTADVVDVSPDPRVTPVSSISVVFSEAVTGFDKTDLNLTRDGGAVSLAAATLTSGDNVTFTLGNLAGLTDRAGTYVLTLVASGSGIIDGASNPLGSNASDTWVMNAINGTAGNDVIRIVSGGGPSITDVFINNATATPDYSIAMSGFPQLLVHGLGGDDTLIIDLAGGMPVPATGLSFDGGANGAGGDTLAVHGSAGVDTTTFNAGNVQLGGVTASYANVESILYDGKGGFDHLTVHSGPLVFPATQRLQSLTMNAGASARLAAGGSRVLHVRSLNMNATASLDLTDNDLIIDYTGASPLGSWNGSNYTGIAGLIQSGRNEGTWNGPGIRTSMSDALTDYTTLAVAEASDALGIVGGQTELFSGETVDGTSVLVKYTYGGDANLDGQLNIDDYGQIDFNAGLSGIVFGFFNGDFNLDGLINIDDYGIIDFNVGIQGLPL